MKPKFRLRFYCNRHSVSFHHGDKQMKISRACNHPLHPQRRANVFTSMNNSDNQSKWEDVSFFSVRESIQWTMFFAICVFASVWASFICYWHFVMVDCWYNGHGSKSHLKGWEIEEFVTVFFFDRLTLPYGIHGNAKQGKAAFRVLTRARGLHFYICNESLFRGRLAFIYLSCEIDRDAMEIIDRYCTNVR